MKIRAIVKDASAYYLMVSALFLFFLFFMMTVGSVDSDVLPFQLFSLLFSCVAFFLIMRSSSKFGWVTLVFIFHLVISGFILYFDILEEPTDVERYQEEAKIIGRSSLYYDGIVKVITDENFYSDINDLGYISITGLVYYIFGDFYAETILYFIKLFFHLATVIMIFKTLKIVYSFCSWCKFVTIFWGINIYATYIAIGGLKENIFTFFISVAMYYLIVLIRHFSIVNLIFFLLALLVTFGFRLTNPLYFLGAYIGYNWLKSRSSRYIFFLLSGIIVIITIGFQLLINYFPIMEGLSTQRLHAEDNSGSSFVAYSFISAFIYPFPSVLSNHINGNLITYTYSIFHLSFSVFAILGIYHVIREKVIIMYPFFIVFFLNVCMIVLTGYSTNARYSYPFVFLYYAFIPFGLSRFYAKRVVVLYMTFALLVSYVYNISKT